ncbi:calpain like thiol protease, partial [Cryptosporidium canis]
RKSGSSMSSLDSLSVEVDHVFELKKMVMEKYSIMMKHKRSEKDPMEDRILIESSFINDSCFLPPLLVNKRSGAGLTKLDNEQVQFLLLMILYSQPLSAQGEIIHRSSQFCLKGQYVLIVEQMVKSLMLSKKQKKMVSRWKKLNSSVELFPANHFINFTSSNIIQGFIGDCSFIVVLSLLLEHEKKFNSSLLSGLITPIRFSVKSQSHHSHLTEDSPLHCNSVLDDVLCLYKCKILINGIWRNIFVDSLIPTDSSNNCLLSHFDTNRYCGITLMEKAYLKVMANRYDSIESNPAIDLYYLTEWIPETISIKSAYEKKKGYFSKLWNRIKRPIRDGYCLMALGTNEIRPTDEKYQSSYAKRFENMEENPISRHIRERAGIEDTANYKYITREEICKQTGLVTKHAYQVLRIVELFDQKKSTTNRLLLLRNPWGKISWKGRFSKCDKESWSSDLEDLLGGQFGYEADRDNGIFWIEWSDILKWFSHIYLAWDPEKVSKHVKKVHGKWSPCPHDSILQDDLHLTYFHPQYQLTIDCKLLSKLKVGGCRLAGNREVDKGLENGRIGENVNEIQLNNAALPRSILTFDSNSAGEVDENLKSSLFSKLWRRTDSFEGESHSNIGDIWIVLNRHIDYLGMDELDNYKSAVNEIPYMSISIFRGRNRIITQERLPLMHGVYSNGSVIMFKTNVFELLREYDYFDLQENKDFVLVITQYQSNKTFNYTLNIYSNVDIHVKLLDTYFQNINYPISTSNFVEVTGKILHYNFNERYYFRLSRESKIKLTPATRIKQLVSKNNTHHHNGSHLATRVNSQTERSRLLILLEVKEKCNNFKLRFFPETFDDQDKIIKQSSSNDSYNNSNCKFIGAICTYGDYFILIDFKEKQQDFIKGNTYKLIIYHTKV